MGRILDKNLYPIDTVVSKDDYLVGTDIDNGLKTVNFSVGSLLRLVNSEANFSSAEFKFTDGGDPEIDGSTQGVFLSVDGNSDPNVLTNLRFNKKNLGGQDLSDLFVLLQNNVYSFSMKLINSSDPSDSFYFKIKNATAYAEFYDIEVEAVGEGYNRSLADLTTYNLFFEILGDQNNRNLVKNASVTGVITTPKVASAINALAKFTVADDQNVYYQITNDLGESATYIPVGKGKGTYGSGGTALSVADISPVSKSDGHPLATAIKHLTYSGDLMTAVNGIASYSIEANTALYFYATPSATPSITYVYVAKNIGAGNYGAAGTALAEDDLELISIIGGNVNLVKNITITGDPTESNVVNAINGLSTFTLNERQSVYFKITPEGTQTSYIFVLEGKGAGTYGIAGPDLTTDDIELISVVGGGSTWNLKVEGTQKKAVTGGESVDFKGKKYAVVTYASGGIVEVSTSQALDDLLATFKPVHRVTKAEHQALIDNNQLNGDALYAIPCVI